MCFPQLYEITVSLNWCIIQYTVDNGAQRGPEQSRGPGAKCDIPCLTAGLGPWVCVPTRRPICRLDPDVSARMNHNYFSLLPFDSGFVFFPKSYPLTVKTAKKRRAKGRKKRERKRAWQTRREFLSLSLLLIDHAVNLSSK